MAKISNFPAALQPIIAQGFLVREFESSIKYYHSFRSCAERVTTDADCPFYSAQLPIIMVTSRVGIASQLLLNAAICGEQAAQKIHDLAGVVLNNAARPIDGGNALTMQSLLNAVHALRSGGVEEIDGSYNCYLNPINARQLFDDNDFRRMFSSDGSSRQVSLRRMINTFIGIRFIPILCLEGEKSIRRTFICGKGALIENVPENLIDASGIDDSDTLIDVIDGTLMLTREPIDRLQQIIMQSWAYMGEFTARPDRFVTIETHVSA